MYVLYYPQIRGQVKKWCHKILLTFFQVRAGPLIPITPRWIVAVEELVSRNSFLAKVFPFSDPPIFVRLVAVDVAA